MATFARAALAVPPLGAPRHGKASRRRWVTVYEPHRVQSTKRQPALVGRPDSEGVAAVLGEGQRKGAAMPWAHL